MKLSFRCVQAIDLCEKLSVFVVGHCRATADGNRALKSCFRRGNVLGHHVEPRQAQVRFNSFWIQFDCVIELRERFLFLVLSKQDAAHQNVSFDVVGVFRENFFRQPLGLGDGRGRFFASGKIIISQPHTNLEVVRVQLSSLPHFFESFLISLQTFISVRQTPMSIGELLVYLQRGAEFERGFLKLVLFQESLAASDMLGFSFFRRGARAQKQGGGNQGKK